MVEDEVKTKRASRMRTAILILLNVAGCALLFLVLAPVVNKWGLVNLLKGLALLNIAVMLHEFGHLIAGKRAGLKIEAFAIGMGPILLRRSKWGIEWRLCLYPIGGYVKSEGENPMEFATPKQVIRYAWGGPFASLLTCFVFVFAAGLIGGDSALAEPPVIADTNSAHAQESGLRKGDVLLKADGIDLTKNSQTGLQQLAKQLQTKDKTTITFRRNGVEHTSSLPLTTIDGQRRIGVAFAEENKPLGLIDSAKRASFITGGSAATPVILPYMAVAKPRELAEGSGGPGTILSILIQSLQGDISLFLFIFGAINGAVGGFQLIPLIPFDGGHILTAVLRKLLRNKPKEVLDRVLGVYSLVSIAVVILLLNMALSNDIMRR